jgi:hypothetical protein
MVPHRAASALRHVRWSHTCCIETGGALPAPGQWACLTCEGCAGLQGTCEHAHARSVQVKNSIQGRSLVPAGTVAARWDDVAMHGGACAWDVAYLDARVHAAVLPKCLGTCQAVLHSCTWLWLELVLSHVGQSSTGTVEPSARQSVGWVWACRTPGTFCTAQPGNVRVRH